MLLQIFFHFLLFFIAGFVQFNFSINRDAFASIIFVVVFGSGIYFLGLISIVTFILGAMVGSHLAVQSRVREAGKKE